MKISSRFSVAVHILSILHFNEGPLPTSEYIAGSVNTNPVVIRRILGMLKQAELVDMKRGTGGAFLLKPVDQITLLDIYKAVGSVEEGQLFHIHPDPNIKCPIGANIEVAINDTLLKAQEAMETVLKNTTLSTITQNLLDKF